MQESKAKTDRETIITIHGLLSATYQGRFQTGPEIVGVWLDLLCDVDPDCVLQATRQLSSQPGQWPPTVGDIRSLAVDLSMGEYAPVSKFEAWERALRVARGEVIATSPEERRALNMIGGAWQIKQSENLAWDRQAFVSHYAELIAKRKRIASTLPEVKQIANLNAPALPPPTTAQQKPKEEPQRRPATQDEVRELLKGYRFSDENKKRVESMIGSAGLMGGTSDV